MTKFLTYYQLGNLEDADNFIGVAADELEEAIIATHAKNLVAIMHTRNQTQIRSWFTTEKLTSKVVYDRKSQQYVGVFSNRYLRLWNSNTRDVNKAKKIKIPKQIHELVDCGEATLLLYTDGSCEELSHALQTRKEKDSKEIEPTTEARIHNATVHTLCDGKKYLSYFVQSQLEGVKSLTLVKIDLAGLEQNEFEDVQRYKVLEERLSHKLMTYAVVEVADAELALFSLWSDGRLYMLRLSENAKSLDAFGNFVATLSCIKVKTPVTMISVAKHFIVLYGASSMQEGASLLLYNTQFKVVKDRQDFKVHFANTRLWTHSNMIISTMGSNLTLINYQISEQLLSDFVGTQAVRTVDAFNAENEEMRGVDMANHIDEEEQLLEALCYRPNTILKPHGRSKMPAKPNKQQIVIADGLRVPFESPRQFEKSLESLSQLNLQVELVPGEEMEVKIMSNLHDAGFPNKLIAATAKRLEKFGASEHEITEKLLSVLIQAEEVQNITACMRRYTNISEKMLAQTLIYAVEQLMTTAAAATAAKDDCWHMLHSLLACSFESVALAMHLRQKLTYPQMLYLLEHLYRLLTENDALVDECFLDMQRIGLDSMKAEFQIFRWLMVLLDANFQTMALSKDPQLMKVLLNWIKLLAQYKEEVPRLQELATLMTKVVAQKQVVGAKQPQAACKWYSIEEVDLF